MLPLCLTLQHTSSSTHTAGEHQSAFQVGITTCPVCRMSLCAHLIQQGNKTWKVVHLQHCIKTNSDSYGMRESFLAVILEQKIGSRWNLIQKLCLFMLLLCMSNFLWPQQMAMCGTCFYSVGHCSTALWKQNIILWPPWLPESVSLNFFLWGHLKNRMYRINLKPQQPLMPTSDWKWPTLRKMFSNERQTTCNVAFRRV